MENHILKKTECVCIYIYTHLNKKGVERYLDDDDCYDTNDDKEKKCHNTFVRGNLGEEGQKVRNRDK